MAELQRVWGVTTLLDIALGMSRPLANHIVTATATQAVERNTVLQAFLKDGDKDGAIKWLERARYEKSDKAKARGTDLHKAAEARAIGQKPDIDPANVAYLDQYDAFLNEFRPEFLMSEAPVYNTKVGYAGTLDAIAKIDGKTVVCDIKTTEHGKDSGRYRPPYPEAALQLSAYRHALEVGLIAERRFAPGGKRYYLYDPSAHHEPMPATDGAICIVVSPDDYMVIPVRSDEYVFGYFRHAVEMARYQEVISKEVYGPPIAPVYDIFGAPVGEAVA